MLFNSTVFIQFFAAFLLLYYLCRNSLLARNLLIVAGSWLFYGWWDYRFLGLLIFSGCFDFAAGLLLASTGTDWKRKAVLALSVGVNLSLLGFFKYYDFFVDSFASLFSSRHGSGLGHHALRIILPVGISFYTFQSLSYVIDVYRRQLSPTRNLLEYLAYVSFFPQLVAGPIQRGHHLLPQLERKLTIDQGMIAAGLWLILWGLFKKVAMADNLAPMVEMVFDNPAAAGPAILAGTLAFAFQVYGDFSGYSDIARGLAKVLGFELQANFNLPYFAEDLRDFWRRWHISLSFWLRDYLYFSLGGNRKGEARTRLNLLTTMLLGGLWHGAAWNFLLWGGWHGMGLIVNRWWQGRSAPALGSISEHGRFKLPSLPRPVAMLATFLFVLYGWLLFRAGSLQRVWTLTAGLVHWTIPSWLPHYFVALIVLATPLLVIETWEKRAGNLLAPLAAPAWLRSGLQGMLLLGVLLFWEKKSVPFIYFQF